MTFATHHTSLENGGRKAGRAAQPPTIETSKQHSKSKAGRKDSKQRFPPTTDPETPAQSIHQDSTNGYQLPSFDNFPIGTAVGFFDDGADDNWEDFAGNVAYYNGTGISSRNRPDHTMAEGKNKKPLRISLNLHGSLPRCEDISPVQSTSRLSAYLHNQD